MKWHFTASGANDDTGVNDTRGLACELVAWRFVTHLAEREAIDHLCYELPRSIQESTASVVDAQGVNGAAEALEPSERTPLFDTAPAYETFADEMPSSNSPDDSKSFLTTFAGLNALEIAAVAEAKKFISQKAIQTIIDGIWKGDIVFWDSLSQHSTKKARIYNRNKCDPFCRLRVPLYLKIFEVLFFAVFLALYYTVLVEKSAHRVSAAEVLLYIWLVSFSYNGKFD